MHWVLFGLVRNKTACNRNNILPKVYGYSYQLGIKIEWSGMPVVPKDLNFTKFPISQWHKTSKARKKGRKLSSQLEA